MAVPEHAEAEKRHDNLLGEEDTANAGINVGEAIAYTSNNDILEDRGPADKRWPVALGSYVTVSEEVEGKLQD